MAKDTNELKAKSQSELEEAKSTKEMDEKNAKSSKKVKKDAEEAKKASNRTPKNTPKDQPKSSGIWYLLSRLVGLRASEAEHEIKKQRNRAIKHRNDLSKNKNIFEKLKQKLLGRLGIDAKSVEKRRERRRKVLEKTKKAGSIIGMLMGLAPLIVGVVKKSFDKLKEKWDDIKGSITDTINGVVGKVVAFGQDIKQGVQTMVEEIKLFGLKVADKFANAFIDLHNFVAGLWNKVASSQLGEFLGLEAMEVKEHQHKADDFKAELEERRILTAAPVLQSDDERSRAEMMAETGNYYAGRESNGGKYDKPKPEADSEGLCARHTIDSINAGLPDDKKIAMPRKASDLYDGNALEKAGFSEIPIAEAKSHPQVGDVVVEDDVPEHPYGHIQLYTGDQTPITKKGVDTAARPWVSDFRQKSTNVHTDVQGDKRAWRYGKPSVVTEESNQVGLGDGSSKSSGVNSGDSLTAATTTNNTVNNYNNNNSRTIITGSLGAEDQRY